jgi:DNA-binding FadR family transcriptional regulator
MKLITDFMSTTFIEILYRHNVEDYIREHGQIIEFIKQRNATAAKKVLIHHFNRTTDWISNFKKS